MKFVISDTRVPIKVWSPEETVEAAAKKQFTKEDLAAQTEGIECRKDDGVVDEIPGAYKKIEDVMEHQKDLVEVVAQLRQILCVKG